MRRVLTGIAWMLLVAGCDRGGPHDHPQLRTGEQFYTQHCAACHRRSGEGAFLQGIPAIKYTSMKIDQIVGHIRGHGRIEDTQMPVFTDMSNYEAERIAVYVRLVLSAR